MAKTYHAPLFVRMANVLSKTLLRAGFKFVGSGSYRMYLLTIRGRKSGQPRTVPIVTIESNGKLYIACQRAGDWVLNLRAAGEAVLTRDRFRITVTARELSPEEALQEEIKNGHPFAKVYGVTADSFLEEFEHALVGRPVFLLEKK